MRRYPEDAWERAATRRAESNRPRTGGLQIQANPGEAQVYLNNEPKGITSPQGEIRLLDLQPGTYKVRISLAGYQTWENEVTISAGVVQTVGVGLVQKPREDQVQTHPGTPALSRPATPVLTELPIPGGKVKGVRFFEGRWDSTPNELERVFRQRFAKSWARAIYWELGLSNPRPKQRIDFKIEAVWYRPDGGEMFRQTLFSYVDAGWKNSHSTGGWGRSNPGLWVPGAYRVDFYIDGMLVASGTFEVY